MVCTFLRESQQWAAGGRHHGGSEYGVQCTGRSCDGGVSQSLSKHYWSSFEKNDRGDEDEKSTV